VSIKRKLSMIAMCLPLALGAMAGGPMPPEEIEKLLHASHQQEIAYVLENREKEDEDEEDGLRRDAEIESSDGRPRFQLSGD